jgi:beta-N-acetylhexosaminidase
MKVEAVGDQTSLSDRKKRAGQRLIVGFSGTSPSAEFLEFCRVARPAGFILFGRNIEEPSQVRELNRELATLVPDENPALLSVDQEGGRVRRIKEIDWPPMRTVGNLDHLPSTDALARAMAEEIRALGFNLDFAPVADVDSNPQNPVIGDRSFGRDPEMVARQVVAWTQAMQSEGVICCAKHYPGHGDTSVDSHLDLPVVDKDPDDIWHMEQVPFRAVVQAGVAMVMTAHVLFPALDEEVPATMSQPILQGWLRERLGFTGVICSDDMEMKAVRGRYQLEHQLDLASRATVDLFIVSEQLGLCWESWETLVRLQESDPLHDSRAIDSMKRVNRVRERFLLDAPRVPELSRVGCRSHKSIASQLQSRGAS